MVIRDTGLADAVAVLTKWIEFDEIDKYGDGFRTIADELVRDDIEAAYRLIGGFIKLSTTTLMAAALASGHSDDELLPECRRILHVIGNQGGRLTPM